MRLNKQPPRLVELSREDILESDQGFKSWTVSRTSFSAKDCGGTLDLDEFKEAGAFGLKFLCSLP